MNSYEENMSKIWISDMNEFNSDCEDTISLIIDRESVAMGDDVYPHTTAFHFLRTKLLSDLCEYIIHGMLNIPIMRWKMYINRKMEIAIINLGEKSFEIVVEDISIQELINQYDLESLYLYKFRE